MYAVDTGNQGKGSGIPASLTRNGTPPYCLTPLKEIPTVICYNSLNHTSPHVFETEDKAFVFLWL